MSALPRRPIPPRRIRTAELLAVGSELTTGETRDSNGGELAASLSTAGVTVRRITALPDELELVTTYFREALAGVDLAVATGGLGPTPDDLTREAISAALGQEPRVDPQLEAWLRAMFARRGMRLSEVNLKQAWLIPAATSIPNDNGTAPGWWVDGPEGQVAVLLPGPPREMRPMWRDWVLPRLRERGLGDGRIVRTLRTYGIGESSVVERLGEELLRRANPVVATYARADWLDIRISAVDEPASDGSFRLAIDILEEAAGQIREPCPGTSGRRARRRGRRSWPRRWAWQASGSRPSKPAQMANLERCWRTFPASRGRWRWAGRGPRRSSRPGSKMRPRTSPGSPERSRASLSSPATMARTLWCARPSCRPTKAGRAAWSSRYSSTGRTDASGRPWLRPRSWWRPSARHPSPAVT